VSAEGKGQGALVLRGVPQFAGGDRSASQAELADEYHTAVAACTEGRRHDANERLPAGLHRAAATIR